MVTIPVCLCFSIGCPWRKSASRSPRSPRSVSVYAARSALENEMSAINADGESSNPVKQRLSCTDPGQVGETWRISHDHRRPWSQRDSYFQSTLRTRETYDRALGRFGNRLSFTVDDKCVHAFILGFGCENTPEPMLHTAPTGTLRPRSASGSARRLRRRRPGLRVPSPLSSFTCLSSAARLN